VVPDRVRHGYGLTPAIVDLALARPRRPGLLVAEWLVERGARHLVLVGRREPGDECRSRIAKMAWQGARVVTEQGDVSREETVQSILGRISVSMPPLVGVIHSAGVLDDGVLLQQNWERFARVMAPKVRGAWALHRATEGLALDFFVLFSSGAAVFGSAGQANHAAANAFLDALAHHRRAQGLVGQSINWGVWSEVGAAADRGIDERVRESGMIPFSPHEGLRALGRMMSDQRPQVVVAPIDWDRLRQRASVPPPFVALLRPGVPLVDAPRKATPSPGLRAALEMLAPARRLSLLQRNVRDEAARVLGLDPLRSIEEDRPLQELGLDSLMAIDLRNRLGQLLEAPLPATLVFDHPTVEQLAAFLGREILGLDRTADAGAAEPSRPAAEQTDGLTGDELAQLLARRLDAIESDGERR
jgi:acyl carrier protein/NADP-dependent 3-hydroxy acid dehydrogenase YdfG